MKKEDLIARMGGSLQAVADLFGISYMAVYLWKDGEDIPELRILQLEKMRPEWFMKPKVKAEQIAVER